MLHSSVVGDERPSRAQGPRAGALARRALQLRVIFIELILPATPTHTRGSLVSWWASWFSLAEGPGGDMSCAAAGVPTVQAAGRAFRILAAASCNVQRRFQINNIRQHAGMRPRAPYSRTADSTQHHWCTASLASAFSEPQPGPSLNAGLSIGQKGHVGRNDLVAICHRLCQT